MRRFDIDLAVLGAMAQRGNQGSWHALADIAAALHVSTRAVQYACDRLVDGGALERCTDSETHGPGWRYVYAINAVGAYRMYRGQEEPTYGTAKAFWSEAMAVSRSYRINAQRLAVRALERKVRRLEGLSNG